MSLWTEVPDRHDRPTIKLGGAVSAAETYVPRPELQTRLHQLVNRDGVFQIYGCRTQGKTSLVWNGARSFLRDSGVATLRVDCGGVGTTSPASIDTWVPRVIRGFWADSQITQIPVAEVTNDSRPPDQAFAVWLAKTRQKIVDTSFANRLLVVIDEIDLARRFLGTSVISMLRSVDNIVRELQGITVALIGLRPLEDDGDLIDGSGSPSFPTFEVGDFDHIAATHRELARIIGADDQIGELTMSWTNGQPFLTMAFLSRLLDRSQTSLIGDKIVEDVAREIIAAQRNEKSILFLTIERYFTDESEGLNREDALEALQTYGVLLEGKSIPLADRPARILRNTGLCRTSHDNIEIKNRLFREVFEKEWIHKTINTVQKRQSGRRGAHTRFSKNRSLWLINTGGTLGMVRRRNEDDDDEYVDQPQSFAEFSASFPELDDWIEGGEQTFALDSINVTPKHWLHLAERIRVLHQEDPRRSFVVVHGTDTMAYTASALAFAFGQSMDFSIVFTGSQTTPDVPHGDARTNLLRACLAAQENVPEVLIAFGDQLFRAVRARKRDERQFAGFEAVGVPPVGDLSERVEVDWTRVRTQLPLSRAGTVVTGWCGAGRRFASLFADKVLSIQLLPGLEPAFYKSIVESTAETCNGIVIQVLGAGNVTSDEEFGFHGLIGIASRNDIPVLLTSRFQWRRIAAREYRPASEAEKLGAIPGGEMTLEAALVKFRWAIAIANRAGGRRRIDLVREIMETNFVGELDGPLSLLEDDHDDKGD